MTIGERIQDQLIQKHMTQKELAVQTGLTESSISHYVHDRRTPRGESLQIIAKALDLTTDELLEGVFQTSRAEWIEIKKLFSRHTGDWTTDQKLELIRILIDS